MKAVVAMASPKRGKLARLDAGGVHYRALNEQIHEAIRNGVTEIVLDNVCGQRYIGNALSAGVRITINGTPGNDLAAFMSGATVIVNGNAQDALGNTMNSGLVVVHGNAGDLAGFSMRGGRIFIRGNAGYRVGIHQKAYENWFPVVMIGGRVGDFLGEYMAGGTMVVLGLDRRKGEPVAGGYLGTGMHGGEMFIRGTVEKWQLGREVGMAPLTGGDWERLSGLLDAFCTEFGLKPGGFKPSEFVRLTPVSLRPYGRLYAY